MLLGDTKYCYKTIAYRAQAKQVQADNTMPSGGAPVTLPAFCADGRLQLPVLPQWSAAWRAWAQRLQLLCGMCPLHVPKGRDSGLRGSVLQPPLA